MTRAFLCIYRGACLSMCRGWCWRTRKRLNRAKEGWWRQWDEQIGPERVQSMLACILSMFLAWSTNTDQFELAVAIVLVQVWVDPLWLLRLTWARGQKSLHLRETSSSQNSSTGCNGSYAGAAESLCGNLIKIGLPATILRGISFPESIAMLILKQKIQCSNKLYMVIQYSLRPYHFRLQWGHYMEYMTVWEMHDRMFPMIKTETNSSF